MKQNREYHPLLDEYIHDFYYLLSLYFNNFLKLSGYKRFLVFTLILNFFLYLIFFKFTQTPSLQSESILRQTHFVCCLLQCFASQNIAFSLILISFIFYKYILIFFTHWVYKEREDLESVITGRTTPPS